MAFELVGVAPPPLTTLISQRYNSCISMLELAPLELIIRIFFCHSTFLLWFGSEWDKAVLISSLCGPLYLSPFWRGAHHQFSEVLATLETVLLHLLFLMLQIQDKSLPDLLAFYLESP
jgi:hypothetical protein